LYIKLRDGREFGLTTLDQPITYMGIEYSAMRGFNSSIIATDAGLSVDNGEATALLSGTVDGITYDMALAGELDDASWVMMLVNWADLSMGHAVLDAGDIGEVRTIDGLIYIPELLSYAMRLQQAIGHVWSRRCRATFGTPASDWTGCGVDAESMWVAGTVTAVGDEPKRVFASPVVVSGFPVPGRVRWTSGPNASGRLYQLEAYSAMSGTIGLLESMSFPVSVDDEFEIRLDCNKSPSQCIAYTNFINYKGEPYIPVGDGLETMTPSAQTFGGLSGSAIID
jgi:uncharacterized phage protein (TIGR02218 family)